MASKKTKVTKKIVEPDWYEVRRGMESEWIFLLSKRVGIKKITDNSLYYLSGNFDDKLRTILLNICAFFTFTKSKHVTQKHIQSSLAECTSGFDMSLEIVDLQEKQIALVENSHKLTIAYGIFTVIVSSLMNEIVSDVTFTENAIVHLQYYFESYMMDLLSEIKIIGGRKIHQSNCTMALTLRAKRRNSVQPFLQDDYFLSGILLVLKQVHPSSGMTLSAITQVNHVISYIIYLITNRAKFIANNFMKTPKINNDVVICAVRQIISGELAKHSFSEGSKAVTNYKRESKFRAGCKGYEDQPQHKKMGTRIEKTRIRTRSEDAGLQLNVKTVNDVMKRYIGRVMKLSNEAVVYVTSVVEYLTAEILELSGGECRNFRKLLITPRHLNGACIRDEELNKFFNDNGIMIIGGHANIYNTWIDSNPHNLAAEPYYESSGSVLITYEKFNDVIKEEDPDEEREDDEDDDTYEISEECKLNEEQATNEEEEKFNEIFETFPEDPEEKDDESSSESDEEDSDEDDSEEEKKEDGESDNLMGDIERLISKYIEKTVRSNLDAAGVIDYGHPYKHTF